MLSGGVTPLLTRQTGENKIIENAIIEARQNGYVKRGDKVIVTAGVGKSAVGSTNLIRLETV